MRDRDKHIGALPSLTISSCFWTRRGCGFTVKPPNESPNICSVDQHLELRIPVQAITLAYSHSPEEKPSLLYTENMHTSSIEPTSSRPHVRCSTY